MSRITRPRHRPSTARISARAVVVGTVVGLIAVNAVLYGFAGGHLPFHASSLVDPPTGDAIVRADLMYLEVAALAVMVYLFTRRREVPDIAERAPDRSRAGREIVAVVAYGAAVLVVGSIIGALCGWHAFGLHLDNMVIRSGDPVTPAEAICWAAYNVVAYAVIPLVVFGRRYSAEQLNLRSSDRRADLMLIVAVLVVESAVQLAVSDSTILDLTARQALIGAPVTFVLSFAGTVLPAMVFIYCILVPRFLRVTGSVPATVVLGGGDVRAPARGGRMDGFHVAVGRGAVRGVRPALLHRSRHVQDVHHRADGERVDACVGLPRDSPAHTGRHPDVRRSVRDQMTPLTLAARWARVADTSRYVAPTMRSALPNMCRTTIHSGRFVAYWM
ncbi:hypothetical protein ACFOJ6_23920 [Gordonia humi]|uniref:hypothetical protein n=1 Tax=Gordonia humi TaxID=686429 RepID=UPI00360B6B7D